MLLGFTGNIKERSIYRTLERLGEKSQFVVDRYQEWLKDQDLIDDKQALDFSSSFFCGTRCPLGAHGYSRDHRPDKKQLTYGVSVGMNKMPTAITIQKGNTQDKKHMNSLTKLCFKILPRESVLIFDCGGNTKKVNEKIRKNEMHYFTLKPKKHGPYLKAIRIFHAEEKTLLTHNNRTYSCVKINDGDETSYVFFCDELAQDQLRKKGKKFKRALEKGAAMSKKVKKNKELGQQICEEGLIVIRGVLQSVLAKTQNPFINDLEGFFILESSLDLQPEEILRLYKDKDVVEKCIRDLKEGTELRPIRHWSENTVKGYLLIVFLTNAIINLTRLLTTNPLVTNHKLLKKYLMNLTLTVIYPKNGFRIKVISNFSAEMKAMFGEFVKKYGDLTPTIWG